MTINLIVAAAALLSKAVLLLLLVHCLLLLQLCVGCMFRLVYSIALFVFSCLAIILLRKKDLVDLL